MTNHRNHSIKSKAKPGSKGERAKKPEKAVPDFNLETPSETLGYTRDQIARETLARYSGTPVEDFQKYILLTNFPHYVQVFADKMNVEPVSGSTLRVAHAPEEQISIIDYRIGAPMAALVMDVLSYLSPQCVLMLGLCGGLHVSHRVGDFLLPMAAIRDEGTSLHYMPAQVPSLPAFLLQQYISLELQSKNIPFKTGVIHTTDYRMWEFDEKFRSILRSEKATAIDMECSALFTAGFAQKVPVGALMLISDLPTQEQGIKTQELARNVFSQYSELHLDCGIDALRRIRRETEVRNINLRWFHFDLPE